MPTALLISYCSLPYPTSSCVTIHHHTFATPFLCILPTLVTSSLLTCTCFSFILAVYNLMQPVSLSAAIHIALSGVGPCLISPHLLNCSNPQKTFQAFNFYTFSYSPLVVSASTRNYKRSCPVK